ncbi:nucleotidyltransferase family protein [Nitratidesulfovibrio vulgaris]|uniref:Nucleotidyl transferase n=1 Tax=Nitratidesulfovibrio vulgaris (strain DP4) TaxID=391774 RepID=A0A0H3AB89_NITV4|nr:nucleotidyltransferase family protein [Nitratidesulfovibrio vulgaris]ABM29600.1 Nucleotidyl transferase [Nitratidesulfovibrio vulgaris DP4]
MKTKNEIKSFIISHNATLAQGLNKLNSNAGATLFVIDDDNRLRGTMTDGDVRRALLQGVRLEDPINQAMHSAPFVTHVSSALEERLRLMHAHGVRHLPVIDDSGFLLGIEMLQGSVSTALLPNIAVIMCGGLGSRLGHLTHNCPKPMLEVGGKPILERIMCSIIQAGISRFFFATHYLKEKIECYFGNGEKWGVQIEYLKEKKRMGTGGALSLMPYVPSHPMLIMNGDILTEFNIRHLLDFHSMTNSIATMAIAEYCYQNPYGVVRHEGTMLLDIDEKPTNSWFINAGIYVAEPSLVEKVPQDTFIDMPTLLLNAKKKGETISIFPICEKWLDIGREPDYRSAQRMIQCSQTPTKTREASCNTKEYL